jgi:hypothetical protein
MTPLGFHTVKFVGEAALTLMSLGQIDQHSLHDQLGPPNAGGIFS